MKKITKGTLKSLARKRQLFGKITQEFSGMTDCNESVNKPVQCFTENEVNEMWMSRNWLRRESETQVLLSNCCYVVYFNF